MSVLSVTHGICWTLSVQSHEGGVHLPPTSTDPRKKKIRSIMPLLETLLSNRCLLQSVEHLPFEAFFWFLCFLVAATSLHLAFHFTSSSCLCILRAVHAAYGASCAHCEVCRAWIAYLVRQSHVSRVHCVSVIDFCMEYAVRCVACPCSNTSTSCVVRQSTTTQQQTTLCHPTLQPIAVQLRTTTTQQRNSTTRPQRNNATTQQRNNATTL